MPKPRPPRPDRHPGRCPVRPPTALMAAVQSAFPAGVFADTPGPEVTKVVLGFIALTDAAPVIIAKERGLFDKYRLTEIAAAKQPPVDRLNLDHKGTLLSAKRPGSRSGTRRTRSSGSPKASSLPGAT